MILTDASGKPVEKPEPPSPGATIEEKIVWLRADAAYRDKVAALAHRAFNKAFRKATNPKRK